jgi:predicted kinase
MSVEKAIVFDIDGTLSNLSHRLHHIQGGNRNWDAFFAAVDADTVNEPVRWLHSLVCEAPPIPILIASGRPDNYRDVTVAWLAEHGIFHTKLYMRSAGDHRADDIVKVELLAQMRADGYDPQLVIDDRQRVVDMWRAEGICCLQCAPHEEEIKQTWEAGAILLDVMVGPSGGGKTTFCNQHFERHAVLSSDEMRVWLLGNKEDQTQNDRVFAALHDLAYTRLKHGLRTVVDATNLRRKDRMAVAALAPKTAGVRYIVVDRPMDEKMATRDWRPEWLLKKHDQTFRSQVKDILAGDGLPNVEVWDTRWSAA